LAVGQTRCDAVHRRGPTQRELAIHPGDSGRLVCSRVPVGQRPQPIHVRSHVLVWTLTQYTVRGRGQRGGVGTVLKLTTVKVDTPDIDRQGCGTDHDAETEQHRDDYRDRAPVAMQVADSSATSHNRFL